MPERDNESRLLVAGWTPAIRGAYPTANALSELTLRLQVQQQCGRWRGKRLPERDDLTA